MRVGLNIAVLKIAVLNPAVLNPALLKTALWFLILATGIAQAYELRYHACDSAQRLDTLPASIQRCGTLVQKQDKLTVEIPFVILQASSSARAEDLLIVIPGGPGAGAQTERANLRYWQGLFKDSSRYFDLLLFSPRGTRGAKLYWQCSTLQQQELNLFAQDLAAAKENQARYLAIKHCLAEPDASEFASTLSAKEQQADLHAMISALPYQNIHLFGDSWGTRIALQLNSDKIKSRILDSVYPPEKGDFKDWLALLDFRFDIYRKDNKKFDALWNQTLAKLQKTPYRTSFETGLEGLPDEIAFVINPQRLTTIAFYALYRENLRQPFVNMLAYLLDEKQGRDDLQLIMQSYLRAYFDPAFSPLAFYAAECPEHRPLSRTEFDALLTRYEAYRYLVDGMWEYDPCRLPAFRTIKQLRGDLQKDVPTLILSGELDPVTPNTWARELHMSLGEKSILYTAAGAGHGIISGDYCAAQLLVDFVREKKLKPDVYCE